MTWSKSILIVCQLFMHVELYSYDNVLFDELGYYQRQYNTSAVQNIAVSVESSESRRSSLNRN